ncbi:HDL284Cp [Eremothecium sinecaudum]|uniref:HDL284Cp n=1 Tax=Eremothecium sinecaudum TaxID=45286 RepID=A0A120K252_9SACH|nr:HDL284Cp [Eremothecium sinecaudum]AMD20460.1 HDL284Cp [Eremothecium sinecaudum]
MSDNKLQRKTYDNNDHAKRPRGFGLASPNTNIVIGNIHLQKNVGGSMEESLPASKLTKRLLDFYLKRGRWKSKRRRPLKIDQFMDNGLKHIRCGVYAGSQDDRPIRCSMRGIKHLYYVSPNVPCMCTWCTLKPSPLRSDITVFCRESMCIEPNTRWVNTLRPFLVGDQIYERQHSSITRML